MKTAKMIERFFLLTLLTSLVIGIALAYRANEQHLITKKEQEEKLLGYTLAEKRIVKVEKRIFLPVDNSYEFAFIVNNGKEIELVPFMKGSLLDIRKDPEYIAIHIKKNGEKTYRSIATL